MAFEKNINLIQLVQKLQNIGFDVTDELVPRIGEGNPWAFVSIYQYLFFDYEQSIKQNISHGISPETFNTKNEKMSVGGIYKILKNVFGYIPQLTLQQFVSNEHANHKILMCQEVVKLIEDRESYLKPIVSTNQDMHQHGDGCQTLPSS